MSAIDEGAERINGVRSAVVLISGSGSNLQALIDAINSGRLVLDIRAVISNRPQAYGLERAQSAGLATRVVDHQSYPCRASFERDLAAAIDAAQADLLILAGFMRILETDFVNRYLGRMINLHPSLLPKYRGLHTHRRALAAGESEHGASVHFVTAELDGGPVIAQARVPILPGDDETRLRHRLAPLEHRLLLAVTALFTHGRLTCCNGQVLLDGGAMSHPLVLDNDLPALSDPA